jgi:hypothetical protein
MNEFYSHVVLKVMCSKVLVLQLHKIDHRMWLFWDVELTVKPVHAETLIVFEVFKLLTSLWCIAGLLREGL